LKRHLRWQLTGSERLAAAHGVLLAKVAAMLQVGWWQLQSAKMVCT
jgi:hypothetical protein